MPLDLTVFYDNHLSCSLISVLLFFKDVVITENGGIELFRKITKSQQQQQSSSNLHKKYSLHLPNGRMSCINALNHSHCDIPNTYCAAYSTFGRPLLWLWLALCCSSLEDSTC